MVKCSECGETISIPFKCKFCGEKLCSKHRLPENHGCEKMKPYLEQQKNRKIIYNAVQEEKEYREKNMRGKGSIIGRIKKKIDSYRSPRSTSYRRSPTSEALRYAFPDMATFTLLGMIFLGYLFQLFVPGFNELFQLVPELAFTEPWRLISPIFLHGNPTHLFVNSIVLFFFGSELEKRIGTWRFVKMFFLSGIIASIGYAIYMLEITGLNTPAVGASGALYGVFAALAIIAPEIRVLAFFIIPMGIRTALVVFALFDLFLLTQQTPIASIAHLTGLVVGLYYGYKVSKSGDYRRSWVI